ncbi:DNA helicase RecQ [Fibrivirga algicola]|uniref:DNA helicase RecQ n=1 Tax=Fibrivirga algicola TaxID=2950420 RepID=A0ABX0QJ57_9BACT|nr:DNA helicase RecQ [Fibrivirga algicola]ARK11624.1 ATP-dependent DNA helicase RecQ [Fibrella sp. ES10-3-2-2]NID12506.1 DNA helicase RecQ [Fibrivirga algicola]
MLTAHSAPSTRPEPTGQDPVVYLKRYYGYDQFRPMQEAIIRSIVSGRDTVVLMPTGGGKSVCFQIPALMLPGLCVVVSPLIALMKDQVEALHLNGIAAAYINSSQGVKEMRDVEANCLSGKIKLLYVSPEKLLSESFYVFLNRMTISMFAIDEAHCISSWGHDFRPEYTQLNTLRKWFPNVPIIALTATADRLTRQDISERLDMRDPAVFIASFNRTNLSLQVMPGTNRIGQIVKLLSLKPDTSGIIYCLSRKSCETLATKLMEKGYSAAFYHAGMDSSERARIQEAFLRDDVRIMCATIAFGMGIDKSNVRWVMHYNMPKNIEGYYQEIGRAGRDGLPSQTVLFYSFADVATYTQMLTENKPANLDLQLAKLERMKQYAEANTCRRQILLSYFSEQLAEPCGNCDVCRSPRITFDATTIAQKALSAIIRLGERVPMNTLIDVLRGSRNYAIISQGFDKIKTYGAGADLKFEEWRSYLHQLINIGVIEVAYENHYALRKGLLADDVLFNGKTISLVRPDDVPKPVVEKATRTRGDAAGSAGRDELFERLRVLRKRIADSQNVPPYVVFTDSTLEDMARQRPTTPDAFRNVSGVGERKLEMFGTAFLTEIAEFVGVQVGESPRQIRSEGTSRPRETAKPKGSTQQMTLELYQQGLTIQQIAQARELGPSSIANHLIQLSQGGYDVDLASLITLAERQEIEAAIATVGIEENRTKPVFEHLGGRYDYGKINITIALMGR